MRRIFKSMIVKIIICVIFIFFAISLFLFFLQNKMVFHPLSEISTLPSDIGLDFQDLHLNTSDSISINAWFVPVYGSLKTILFCHGNAGNISHRLDSINIFHKLGYNVLIFDYRGYGKSEGNPSEKGTYLDGDVAYEHLLKKGIAERDIVIFGRSLGGAVAADLASRKKPAGLILESTFTSISDMAATFYPFLPTKLLCKIKYNTIAKVKKIQCPTLIIHSPRDEIIPFQMGQKLYETASQPKYFLEIRGSHNDGYVDSGELYENGLKTFLTTLK